MNIKASPGLLRSYLRTALRRMRLQKAHSLINIGGLALGLTACLLAILWIQDEAGYDRFHERADSIAQVFNRFESGTGAGIVHMGSYYPLAAALKARCPEVVEAARIATARRLVIRSGDRVFNSDVLALADPEIFRIFSFSFVRGSAETALADKSAIVLTESMARKYFGAEDPIGRVLHVNGEFDARVTAVIKDLPAQSSLRFGGIAPYALLFAPSFEEPTHWGGNPFETWILLSPGADRAALEAKITAIAAPNFGPGAGRVDFRLHPLLRKRLHSPDGNSLIRAIALFACGTLFVLALACINFVNLSTAAAAARAKEIGVRKAIGARRSDIVRQFLGESLGLSFFALAAALVLLAFVLPLFNRIADKALAFGAVLKPSTIVGSLVLTALTGLAAGIYPAFALSSFRPREVLSGRRGGGARRSAGLRRGLVVFQFTLSLVLVVGTAVVGRQMAFIKSKDLGFDRRDLVLFRLGPVLSGKFESFRTELLRTPGVVGVTSVFQNPVNIGSTVFGDAIGWPGKDPASKVTLNWDFVDYDYFETMRAAFAAGRSFSRDFPSDARGAFVINESAARLMGLDDPIGKSLKLFLAEGAIVGVVRDYHFQPLRHAIKPIVFQLRPSARAVAVVRIAPGTAAASLRAIGAAVRRIDPDTMFESLTFDDLLVRSEYSVEQKIWTVSSYLTAAAVFVACIGLFGLALFMTQQRTKEIGIRKILGASAAGLAWRLAWDFLVWVALAVVLACPLAYWVSARILGVYAYRTSVGAGIFVLSGLAILAVAALTVSAQTLRAARANPAESLRYE